MRLVHRQRGPGDRAPQAEAGNVGAQLGWLDALHLLASKEHLQAIAVPALCRASAVHVCWSTLASAAPTNRGVPSASEWLARGISGIKRRTTGSVAAARCSSLSTRRSCRYPGAGAALVNGKEERAAADDRTAERAAELVALERMRIRRGELEEVARVERVVTEEFVGLAAELVGARARDQVDDRARHVAVLRR